VGGASGRGAGRRLRWLAAQRAKAVALTAVAWSAGDGKEGHFDEPAKWKLKVAPFRRDKPI
jgi:hypothetical protein